jgi:hypothetical protein
MFHTNKQNLMAFDLPLVAGYAIGVPLKKRTFS